MQINKGMQINREKKYTVQAFTCVQVGCRQPKGIFQGYEPCKRKENTGGERH